MQNHETKDSIVPSSEGKKTYRSPKLVSYGDFRSLTLGVGGNTPDGGGRKTKLSPGA
jgi:hypothetical protein